jgi:hypothetical protein
MSKKYRQQAMDQVKLRIIQWAVANPDWSPESLIAISKMFIKHYGLNGNRYLPPDFKREETEVPVDPVQRVEGADSTETQPG